MTTHFIIKISSIKLVVNHLINTNHTVRKLVNLDNTCYKCLFYLKYCLS